MMRLPSVLLALAILSAGALMPVAAQSGDEPRIEDRVDARALELERLLATALNAAEDHEWDLAFQSLDEAEAYGPQDPRIPSYRKSFLELAALEDAHQSWSSGRPADVAAADNGGESAGGDGSGSDGGDAGDGEPKFTIDRGDRDPRESPILTRHLFRAELALKMFAVDPIDTDWRNTWSSATEFFYASFGADVGYWMPVLRRSLGFGFRSSGYSYRPGKPETVFNTLDLGVNLRGFLLESKTSRLELGLEFGGALQTGFVADGVTEQNPALYLGLRVTDPLFFHIFEADSLEPLIFGGGIRIYSSRSEEILEMLNYRLEGFWTVNEGHFGLRLEWWDFINEGDRTNMLGISLIGGYSY